MDSITKKILKVFEEISQIPRQSGQEKKISSWLKNWALERKFAVQTDELNNILIHIPATKGYEDYPIVILQGHMDMICEKTFDSNHNFNIDPIQLVYDGDWLKAKNTTLGADNGIAIAYALALVESELPHCELELLFTTGEENGLVGAKGLSKSWLKGRCLINLDSETEGAITIGSGGTSSIEIRLPIHFEFEKVDDQLNTYVINIKGCRGGHSGFVGNLKHFANANKLLTQTLWRVSQGTNIKIVSIKGGESGGQIAKEAKAKIVFPPGNYTKIKNIIWRCESEFQKEFKPYEKEINVSFTKTSRAKSAISKQKTKDLINFLLELPHGVKKWAMSEDSEVQLQLNNFGAIRTEKKYIVTRSLQRSKSRLALEMNNRDIEYLAHKAKAKYIPKDSYKPWVADYDSFLLNQVKMAYLKLFNKQPIITDVHAGLECGVISSKYKDMDAVSIGPTIESAHTVKERLYIPSVKKVWDLLEYLLKNIQRTYMQKAKGDKEMNLKKRYLDSEVFYNLERPQYPQSCSISSITSCFKYFGNNVTQEEIAKIIGVNIKGEFAPGNFDVRDWIEKVANELGIKMKVEIYFKGGWYLKDPENNEYWNALRKFILDKDRFNIMHIESHYAPLTGFAQYPDDPMEKEDQNRWLFIADPSPFHKQSKIESQHLAKSPPLWSLRWGIVRQKFSNHDHYGIISIQKNN